MVKRMYAWLIFLIFLVMIAGILLWGVLIGEAVRNAMHLCVEVLIPALFPLAVISAWMMRSSAAEYIFSPLSIPASHILRTTPKAIPAVFLGILCGYPIGALCLQELHKTDSVSKSDAQRLASCCTNAGPAFLIGVAGRQMLGSAKAGFLLLLVQITASLLTMLFLRPKQVCSPHAYAPRITTHTLASFPESVAAASISMLNITGFVAITSVICTIVHHIFSNNALAALFSGIIELTNGLHSVSALSVSLPVKFILFSALLGFSGVCVHLQVASAFLPGSIGMRDYFAGKLFHAGCSTLLSIPIAILLRKVSVSSAAFSPVIYPPDLSGLGNFILMFSVGYTFLWKFRNGRCIINKGSTSGGNEHVI